MIELQLAVNLNGWRIFIRRKEDKAFLPVANKIHDRDNYTCQYCGFQARRFQEIARQTSAGRKLCHDISSVAFEASLSPPRLAQANLEGDAHASRAGSLKDSRNRDRSQIAHGAPI